MHLVFTDCAQPDAKMALTFAIAALERKFSDEVIVESARSRRFSLRFITFASSGVATGL